MIYQVTIELRGLVRASSAEDAMRQARATATALATAEVGRLSDHNVDETEAVRVQLHGDQNEDV